MTDDDKSLGDDATLGGKNPEQEVDAQSLGDQSTHDGQADTDSVGDSSSLGDQLTFGGEETDGAPDDGMEIVDLESRYTIERVLGKGGMGEVLLATDTRLERKVAIKRILGKAARSKTAVNRFLTEAKSVAALNHPNIVQIHDYGRDKDGPFLIMEYVAGESLLERCQQGAIALKESIELAVQLCDGLAAAHDAHIVHRDVKPANILLTKNNIPKLTDFGLAKAETVDTGMTQSGAVLGTLDFMPPEQRKDATQVDARSDLWSLAATLYQMVTGETPRVIDLDAVPRELRSSLAQALKTNKDDRYQSANELGTTLRECLTAPAHTPITELGAGECPSCHTRNEASRKFCNGCAGPLRASCFDCEKEIPVWDKVCGECGCNQHEKITQLQEERAKHRDVAEQLLKDNDYEGASEIAEQLKLTANHRIAEPTGWLDSFLEEICRQKESEINTMRALMDEAIAHQDAHDYRSGLTVLDKIPLSLRNQTIPNHDKTPAELSDGFKHRLTQIQTLDQEIKQRIENRELDGLRELINELVVLQPGRPDLARLTQKLDERDARYNEKLNKALSNVDILRRECKFLDVAGRISKIPEEFRSEEVNEILNDCQRLASERGFAMSAMNRAIEIAANTASRHKGKFLSSRRSRLTPKFFKEAVKATVKYRKALTKFGLKDAEFDRVRLHLKKLEKKIRNKNATFELVEWAIAFSVIVLLVVMISIANNI